MRQVAPRQKFHPSTRPILHGAQKLVAGQYNNWMEKQWYLTARTQDTFIANDRRCDLSTHTTELPKSAREAPCYTSRAEKLGENGNEGRPVF